MHLPHCGAPNGTLMGKLHMTDGEFDENTLNFLLLYVLYSVMSYHDVTGLGHVTLREHAEYQNLNQLWKRTNIGQILDMAYSNQSRFIIGQRFSKNMTLTSKFCWMPKKVWTKARKKDKTWRNLG